MKKEQKGKKAKGIRLDLQLWMPDSRIVSSNNIKDVKLINDYSISYINSIEIT